MKWLRIYITITMLILTSCKSKKVEEMMQKANQVKVGMHMNEVHQILGEPEYKATYKNWEDLLIILESYNMDHPFDYRYRVVYDEKDSLVISADFE